VKNFDLIKKINKTVVHEESGTIDTFDKQLIRLMSGVYDTTYPMIVSAETSCISYITSVDKDLPLLMNVSTVIKIKDKHAIGYEFVSNCEKMLRESVLAFESLTQSNSIVVLLDEFDQNNGNPIIAVCRNGKDMGLGSVLVNEITSIYDKERFANFLVRSYEEGKTFYKNKKTGLYFTPSKLQLPEDIKYALSDDYHTPSFSKSQVENDLKGKTLDTLIQSASNRASEPHPTTHEKTITSAPEI